jgi:tetratricopeptide (TPR) repeat protein
MTKLGRNDLCHCGSGKKYKKCCMEKDEKQAAEEAQIKKAMSAPIQTKNPISIMQWLSYDEVNDLTTEKIIMTLEQMNIPFHKETFLEDINHFYSAHALAENWFNKYEVSATDRMEDFPFYAAWILWERLAPTGNLSSEQIEDLLNGGFELLNEGDSVSGCNLWLKAWEAIKSRREKNIKNLKPFEVAYRSFSVANFSQDLESELHNAGLEDTGFFEKRIDYCSEFCELFPEELELIQNMRKAIAESYSQLGHYDQAEAEFKQIVRDYPENPWGYIGWGDMYFMDKMQDFPQAKAFKISKDIFDKSAVKERILEVEQKI